MTDKPEKPTTATINEHATLADLKAKKERQQPRADDTALVPVKSAVAEPRQPGKAELLGSSPKQPRPDRVGKKLVAGYFPIETTKALKHISVDEGMTLQQIMAEAFALYIESKKKRR